MKLNKKSATLTILAKIKKSISSANFTKSAKTTLSFAILFSQVLVFQSCTKSKNQKSDLNQKNKLELSFSQKLDKAPLFYLTSLIGTGSGKSESFGEQKDLLLFFQEDDCETCKKVKPALEEFIKKSGTKIYSYSEDPNDSAQEKENFLKKLGSSDGQTLTAARLIAFVNGKRVASISGTYDLESAEKIENFAKNYFNLPPKIKSQELRELSGLKDLRQALNEENDFILYLNRFSCPYCRSLEDPKKFDTISYIAQNSNAKIFTLTSENALKELKNQIIVDGIKYKSAFEYFDKSGASEKLWNSGENEKKKTEFIEILLALNLIKNNFADFADDDFTDNFVADDEKFFKEISNYAFLTEDKFISEDRNVPCFIVCKKSKPISSENQNQIKNLLEKVYELSLCDNEENSQLTETSRSKIEDLNLSENSAEKSEKSKKSATKSLHRINFTNYFAPSASKLDAQTYNSALLEWISLSLF